MQAFIIDLVILKTGFWVRNFQWVYVYVRRLVPACDLVEKLLGALDFPKEEQNIPISRPPLCSKGVFSAYHWWKPHHKINRQGSWQQIFIGTAHWLDWLSKQSIRILLSDQHYVRLATKACGTSGLFGHEVLSFECRLSFASDSHGCRTSSS